jgi:zinc/manganese transport system substrate-binding protein
MLEGIKIASAVVFVLVVAIGCGGQGASGRGGASDGGPVRVIATYSILGDMVENVGGDGVELTTLVGPEEDTHTFEPSPSDQATLSEADLVLENGLEFEPWLDDLYESSGSGATRAVVTENIEPLAVEEGEHAGGKGDYHEEGGEHGDEEHAHEHGEHDPHVWHDVGSALTMVGTIRGALTEADPENAETYEENAGRYLAELEELDAEVTEQAESIPDGRRTLFTSHDTLGYFADRYGFEVDTALGSVSTEASDPSAGETAVLAEEIRASGLPAIFAENVSNQALMERIASEAGVELAPPLFTDALGEPGTEGATYVEMERHNARTMAEALSQ